MTSERQVRANRRNALRSTGPRTLAGKRKIRFNARTHGLLAQDTLLPDENPEALEALVTSLHVEFEPVGEMERMYVDLVAREFWRLQRLGRVEAGIFAWEHYGILAKRALREAKEYEVTTVDELIEKAEGDTGRITDEDKYTTQWNEVKRLWASRESALATVGLAFIRGSRGADAFSKLSRYEAAIHRNLSRALHELQRLQATRRGGHLLPPPLALDVNVDGALVESA